MLNFFISALDFCVNGVKKYVARSFIVSFQVDKCALMVNEKVCILGLNDSLICLLISSACVSYILSEDVFVSLFLNFCNRGASW